MNDYGDTRQIDLERFWVKADICDPEDCWEWLACKNRGGYGTFWFGGKVLKAHRLAWQFTYGSIPEGLYVCHRCDNPSCVNPYHLFLGTHTDNMRDAAKKDRMPHQRGEENGSHKLTEDDVLKIRQLIAEGKQSQRGIAREFGVCATTVRNIEHGTRWGWLK